MEQSVAIVLKGFLQLNSAQRKAFVDEINRIQTGAVQDQVMRESVRKSIQSSTINFGPAPAGGCPCCGK